MAILFMGGEEIDFDRFYNNVTINTSTSSEFFRTDFARCAVNPAGGGEFENRAYARLTQASSSFWFTARAAVDFSTDFLPPAGEYRSFISFSDGTNRRLAIKLDRNRILRASAYSGSTETVLATGTESAFALPGLVRIDVQVSYGASGRIRVFVNQIPFIDYTGNILAGGSTTLDGFSIGSFNTGFSGTSWSEIIVADQDTRTLSLKTQAPVATATGHAWLGSQTDINEVRLDESNMITTDTLDTVAKFTVGPLPAGNYAVRGFKVSAWAAKGPTGPGRLNLGVTTNGEDKFGPDLPLDTGWGKVSQTFDLNPSTGTAWTQNEINAIQIAAKSKS